jgi:CheY-like chemotaxis protein
MDKTGPTGKQILAVGGNPDVLGVLQERILEVYPESQCIKATTSLLAVELIIAWAFDLLILDFQGIEIKDLLDLASLRDIPVILLTAIGLSSDKVQGLIKKGSSILFPKEKLGEIGFVLEDLLFKTEMAKLKQVFWWAGVPDLTKDQ